MPQTKNCLIVGAGIGGLGAATAIAQKGIRTEIVEIKPEPNVYGVGINQPGNSLRALKALGVLDEVCAAGFQFDGWDFYDNRGALIVGVTNKLSGGQVPENNGLSRRDLHTILIGAAEREGVPIRYGTTVSEIEDEGSSVRVEFTDGTSSSYDLVVGFDGIRSPLRQRLFGSGHDPVYAGVAIWRVTVAKPPEVTRGALFQSVGAKAGYIPLSPETMYLLLVTPETRGSRPSDGALVESLKERLSSFAGIIGEIRDHLEPEAAVVYSPLNEVMLPSPWFKNRIVVCGDAAHACAPHLTQGAAMALEDAIVLADELASHDTIRETLDAFCDRRYRRANFVQKASRSILDAEMSVTHEHFADAISGMRTAIPEQFAVVDAELAQPA